MNHYIIKEIKPRTPAAGVETRLIHGERMTMAFFMLQPGSGVPLHSHHHEQFGAVLKGSIELSMGEEKREIHEGEAYHIPSNALHCATCGKSPSEIIEVFSPPRDDLR